MGQSGELPASATHCSSGLSVGEGISPLEGTGPAVLTLWFLGRPGACLGREVGGRSLCLLHFDTELTLNDLARLQRAAESLLKNKLL